MASDLVGALREHTPLHRKVLAFVVLVVLSLVLLVVLTAVDPFGGNVALTAAVEAVLIGVLAYLLTFVAVPRARSRRARARQRRARRQVPVRR